MTVKAYIEKVKALDSQLVSEDGSLYSDAAMESIEVWSNNACCGYLLMAAKDAGLADDTVKDLMHSLRGKFDVISVEEAEENYVNSCF